MDHFSKPLDVHTRAARRHLFVGRFLEPQVNRWRAAVWGILGNNPEIASEALGLLQNDPTEGDRAAFVQAGLVALPRRRRDALLQSVQYSPLIQRLFKLRMHERKGPISLRERRAWKDIVSAARMAVLSSVEKSAARYMNPYKARAVAVMFAENYGPFLQGLHLRRIHHHRALSRI